eukprot:scaffold1307_cov200-Pinguiococcus_pyrenoidosus.AAC.114
MTLVKSKPYVTPPSRTSTQPNPPVPVRFGIQPSRSKADASEADSGRSRIAATESARSSLRRNPSGETP